jgi:hypothetical protein
MQRIFCVVLILPIILFCSCASTGKTEPSQATIEPTANPDTTVPAEQPEVTGTNPDDVVVTFDTVTITKKTFQNTKTEMEIVVEELNKITFQRDYVKWLTWLSEEYIQMYSDPEMLQKVSLSLPTKGIKLKNLKDYFDYVFVPSRQNMRVDDIQFVSPTRVYVIMEIKPGSPAAIYILEKYPQGWKLVPKNQ